MINFRKIKMGDPVAVTLESGDTVTLIAADEDVHRRRRGWLSFVVTDDGEYARKHGECEHEREAAQRAHDVGLGASEWESFMPEGWRRVLAVDLVTESEWHVCSLCRKPCSNE